MAKRAPSLVQLLESLRRAPFDNRPSIEVFPSLDIDRMSVEMRLPDLGRERGLINQPPPSVATFDEVEARVIERVVADQRKSHGVLEDELRTYAERLSSLDFEGRFGAVRRAAPEAVSEFRSEAAKGLDELHELRGDIVEIETYKDDFRKRYRLVRPPWPPSSTSTFLKWSIIVFICLLETGFNGTFLANANELGLVGGIAEAFGFALLNVGIAVLAALLVRELNHRSVFRKLWGLFGLAAYLGLAGLLNLSMAHYREVSGTLLGEGGAQVIARIATSPFELADVQSWILLGIGVLLSLAAFIDARLLWDPYPGYGQLEQRLRAARKKYRDSKEYLIDQLSDIRSDYTASLDEISRDLSVRRSEHDAILANRARVISLFSQHQGHLSRGVQALLTTYRESNVAARSSPPPPHFLTPYSLPFIAVTVPETDARIQEELRQAIRSTQSLIADEVTAVHAEFDKAVRLYRQIDEIVEKLNGAAAKA